MVEDTSGAGLVSGFDRWLMLASRDIANEAGDDEAKLAAGSRAVRFMLMALPDHMPPPRISSGENGSIRAEWDRRGARLVIESHPESGIRWVASGGPNDRPEEGGTDSDGSLPAFRVAARMVAGAEAQS